MGRNKNNNNTNTNCTSSKTKNKKEKEECPKTGFTPTICDSVDILGKKRDVYDVEGTKMVILKEFYNWDSNLSHSMNNESSKKFSDPQILKQNYIYSTATQTTYVSETFLKFLLLKNNKKCNCFDELQTALNITFLPTQNIALFSDLETANTRTMPRRTQTSITGSSTEDYGKTISELNNFLDANKKQKQKKGKRSTTFLLKIVTPACCQIVIALLN